MEFDDMPEALRQQRLTDRWKIEAIMNNEGGDVLSHQQRLERRFSERETTVVFRQPIRTRDFD